MSWQLLAGAACGFLVALATTPAGVSGAVLLLPVQVSILGVPSPAVTPTNLLFNIVAVPGGLWRFWRERRLFNALSPTLIAGTLPGVVAGAIVRVEFLAGGRSFMFIVSGVLLPLGLWLLLGSQRIAPSRPEPGRRGRRLLYVLTLAVGVIGGIYGIGGGSLLAPALVGVGFSIAEVAPAALASTFLTSIVGVVTYAVLSLRHSGSIAPDWTVGIAIGIGGLAGGWVGTGLQSRVPEAALKRTPGIVAVGLALRYLVLALT